MDLGQSSQNYVEYGLGADGSGNGTYDLQQGACSFAGGTTTCTLSGAYTGATAGFTGGSYSFVTTYSGSNLGSLTGVSEAAPNQDYFQYSSASSSLSMVLNLTPTSGSTVSETLVSGGLFTSTVDGINFVYTSYSCSGTAPANGCDPYDVGITSGAVGQGPVTGAVTFNVNVSSPPTGPSGPTSAVPEPCETASLGLTLLTGCAFWVRRRNVSKKRLVV